MARLNSRTEGSELRAALHKLRGGLYGIAGLSAAVNVLTLAGSIYLMMVYDRVLPAASLPTLFSVFAMILVAYAFYGMFDVMRSQMLADVAAALDESLGERVQAIEMRIALERPDARERVSPTRDLDQLRSFIGSAGPPALIDLPWILFFLLILSIVHYWLGVVTLVGMIALGLLTLVAERVSRRHVTAVTEAAAHRRTLADRQWRHAELIRALGMEARTLLQWRQSHAKLMHEQAALTDTTAMLAGISKVSRMVLQSMVLTVGAILVIEGKATAGVIFASSILSGRALAPVDAAIANWKNFVGARQSWTRLDNLLGQTPRGSGERTLLPAPQRTLAVESLALTPPGGNRPVIADVSFRLQAGQALGIIGPSGSGKSSLVRGVIGAWKPARGAIRLDDAALDQWDADTLGRHIGYVPQSVELFAGTIAQNIARFDANASDEAVIAAAEAAGVHKLVVGLPDGYGFQVGEEGGHLSAGQRQRIALARALYRDPFLVVLDEPNSNLDQDGELALAQAIAGVRRRGGIVLLVAHRASILATVDLALLMTGGAARAFGPRDEVLAALTRKPDGAPAGNLAVVAKRS